MLNHGIQGQLFYLGEFTSCLQIKGPVNIRDKASAAQCVCTMCIYRHNYKDAPQRTHRKLPLFIVTACAAAGYLGTDRMGTARLFGLVMFI